jgi:hypothetical protein
MARQAKGPIVYLDTQDFIRFRNSLDDSAVYAVYKYLKDASRLGRVQLGYSAVHIWEFITPPNDSRFLGDRRERGKLLLDVCGKNAFPFFTDLANGASFPNAGNWVPRDIDHRIGFDKLLRKALSDAMVKNGITANRAAMRKVLSQRTLREFSSESNQTLSEEELDPKLRGTPLAPIFIQNFRRYLCGRLSERQLEDRLFGWMNNPSEYAYLWYEFSENTDALVNFIIEPLSKIGSGFEVYLAQMKELENERSRLIEVRREIAENLKDDGLSSGEVRRLLPTVKELPRIDMNEYWTSEKVAHGLFPHFPHYANKRVRGVGKFQPSDLTDIVHMAYAPGSDLFRCDVRMSNLFSDYAPFKDKLVGRLEELPSRIEMWRPDGAAK